MTYLMPPGIQCPTVLMKLILSILHENISNSPFDPQGWGIVLFITAAGILGKLCTTEDSILIFFDYNK